MITVESVDEMLVLNTKRWGKLKIDLNEVITFPKGIPGFDEYQRYVIFEAEDIKPFQWLICLDNPDLGFVIIPPYLFCPDYRPKLFESDLKELKVEPKDQLAMFAIVTLSPNPLKSTANLQGPLLINLTKKMGKQIVVVDEKYTVKHPIIGNEKN